MRLGRPFRGVVSAFFALALGLGPATGCVSGSNDEEKHIACGIQAESESCVCAEGEGGDRDKCTAADVGGGACFGAGDYCACRPWRCWGTKEPCSCEFGNAHVAHECSSTNCCFFPDQNGGFCNCLDETATCPGKKVTNCNFETIEPLLADTDGAYPRVDECPL